MTTTACSTRSAMRRTLYGVFGMSALGGLAAAVMVLPSAGAAPDPCAASEIARTIGSVSANTGSYLDSHPDTNAAFTSASKQQPAQAVAAMKTYFDAHPQAAKDMQAIQQPLQTVSSQCKLPISLPQALQMMQGAGQGGGTTSPLGGSGPASTAPSATVPAATAPTVAGATTTSATPAPIALR